MRTIRTEIFDASTSLESQTPCVFVDVYASVAARATLDSTAQWEGLTDPMKGIDSNVAFDRVKGSVTLAAGSTVAHVTGGSAVGLKTIKMEGWTLCRYSSNSAWWRDTIYTILGYDVAITAQESSAIFSFQATASILVNSAVFFTSYSSVGVGVRECFIYIADDSGRLIGTSQPFTPSASTTQITVTGLAATLTKGRNYQLVIGYKAFSDSDLAKLGAPSSIYYQNYTLNISAQNNAVSPFIVPYSTGGFSLGGQQGYQHTGSLYRQIDMGSTPTTEGIISFTDVVPSGTVQVVDIYGTDDTASSLISGVTGWTKTTGILSGGVVGSFRYFRAHIQQTANTINDEAPIMARIEISYRDLPITLGTHKEHVEAEITGYHVPFTLPLMPSTVTRMLILGSNSLDNISTKTASMNPKLATSMTGKITLTLTTDQAVMDLMSKQLRGKLADIRVGYIINGTPVSDHYYSGIVSDMSWGGSKYSMTLQDDMDFVDVQVPREKAGDPWSNTEDYAVNTIVVYGTASWKCLIASGPSHGGAVTPGTDPLKWQNNGTVWAAIYYASQHLADVAQDLLINHINLPTQRIDLTSFSLVKAAHPSVIGTRLINKPVGAITLLSEIAWLLRSQWAVRNGRLALILEPATSTNPVGVFGDKDVSTGLNYRRGWSDLKNTCLILSGYSGDGEGQEQFYQSEAYADNASILAYEMVGLEVFKDKWNIPTDQLINRATEYVDRWKNGRRIISFSSAMRLLAFETGDVVTFSSMSMPPHDRGSIKCIIVGQDIDWLKQQIKFTLMEI